MITKIELLSADENETPKIKTLLSGFHIMELDDGCIERTVEVRRNYKLKLPDAIIAGTALARDTTLVTHNLKDFSKIPNLRIIDPLEPSEQ